MRWNTHVLSVLLLLGMVPALARAQQSPAKDLAAGKYEPAQPPAQMISDDVAQLRFALKPGWNVARKDKEISTFHLDARTAPRKAELRAVANLAFNPFPLSTFSSAFFYLSVTPRIAPSACMAQTSIAPEKPLRPETVAGTAFSRGLDEHGRICTESRDVTYTAMRNGKCVRFDLAVNSFCGGEVSGVRDMTDLELASVFRRLEEIMETVEFTSR